VEQKISLASTALTLAPGFSRAPAACFRLRQHRIHQPRKTRIELVQAQAVLVIGAFGLRMHQPRIAQDAEVVGHARFGAAAVQLAAGGHFHARQVLHDFQADGVAERVENPLERQLVGGRVLVRSHLANGKAFDL